MSRFCLVWLCGGAIRYLRDFSNSWL